MFLLTTCKLRFTCEHVYGNMPIYMCTYVRRIVCVFSSGVTDTVKAYFTEMLYSFVSDQTHYSTRPSDLYAPEVSDA